MGNALKINEFCIGLFDNDLHGLSHHLKVPYDYVDAVTDVASFICTRYRPNYVESSRHSGKLLCFVDNKSIGRVIIAHGSCKAEPHKIVSFHFPFCIERRGEGILITLNGREINCYVLAKVKEICKYLRERNSKIKWREVSYTLVDVNRDMGNDETDPLEPFHLAVYSQIASAEPGYIRYDFDMVAENGTFHPLHHLDINFHALSSYKCGLYNNITVEDFERLFMHRAQKLYLHPYDSKREDLICKILGNRRKSSTYHRGKAPETRKHIRSRI